MTDKLIERTPGDLADVLDAMDATDFRMSLSQFTAIREASRWLRKMDGERIEPLEMYLCEANAVVLKPQIYRFVVDPDCESCKKAEIDGLILHPPSPTAQKRTQHPVSSEEVEK